MNRPELSEVDDEIRARFEPPGIFLYLPLMHAENVTL